MIWIQNPYEEWQYFGIDVGSEKLVATIEHTNEGHADEDRFWAAWLYGDTGSEDGDIHVDDCDTFENAKAATERALSGDRKELDQVGKVE